LSPTNRNSDAREVEREEMIFDYAETGWKYRKRGRCLSGRENVELVVPTLCWPKGEADLE
jgi:hypothetical protein